LGIKPMHCLICIPNRNAFCCKHCRGRGLAHSNGPGQAKAEPGRKLILAPGPNNPVGVAWIGLDRSGYGIHGTPEPEKVGRTESHGCFRLANWDARTLVELAWTGLPVVVEP
jgi:lipoprotein-anchoring transpeptidase ErfK/SrfK